MENHVHLIVYDEEHHISQFMHLLGMAYSGYFNRKYERSGHLFSSRFLSVPIESEEYLLTAFRYVLNGLEVAMLLSRIFLTAVVSWLPTIMSSDLRPFLSVHTGPC